MFPDYRLAREVKTLSAAGHRILVLSREGRYHGYRLDDPSVSVLRINVGSPVRGAGSSFSYLLTLLRSPMTLTRLAHAWKADAIHVQDLTFSFSGLIAAKALRIPFLVEFRDPYHIMISEARLILKSKTFSKPLLELCNKILATLEFMICHGADFVVCVSDGEKIRLSRLGIRSEKIVTIMNVPSTDEIPKRRRDRPSFVRNPSVVYAGTLSPWKGVNVLLKAFKLLLSEVPNARLLILGDGISRNSLESQANQLSVSKNVTFFGWREPREAFETIAFSKVAVIPHLIASMPDKLFVYMQCATPIVASDFSEIAKILDRSGCGILFRSGDEQSLAQSLKLVLDNRELQLGLTTRAKLAAKRYNWENESLKLIAMYNKLAMGELKTESKSIQRN